MGKIVKLFSLICFIAYLLPSYGQTDTITADGLCLEYDRPYYTTYLEDLDEFDIKRGELEEATKNIHLNFKRLPQYIISESFGLLDYLVNPIELTRSINNFILSKWIHEDGECILFITSPGLAVEIDKSINELPKNRFNSIKQTLGMGSILDRTTDEQMKEIKKIINIWSPKKSKKTFNAQYVITYPVENEKAVYMGKYTHKFDLVMIKWGKYLSVSFLVTEKGFKNIDKYKKEVESAFWFED